MVLENNGIGYLIYVSNPYSYKIGDVVTIYLYQQIKEDEHLLFEKRICLFSLKSPTIILFIFLLFNHILLW